MLIERVSLTEPQGIPGIIIFKMNEGKVLISLIISALALAFERTGERTARSGKLSPPRLKSSRRRRSVHPTAVLVMTACSQARNSKELMNMKSCHNEWDFSRLLERVVGLLFYDWLFFFFI